MGLSARTIWTWVYARKLGVVRLGRAVRIPQAAIEELIESGSIPAVKGFLTRSKEHVVSVSFERVILAAILLDTQTTRLPGSSRLRISSLLSLGVSSPTPSPRAFGSHVG